MILGKSKCYLLLTAFLLMGLTVGLGVAAPPPRTPSKVSVNHAPITIDGDPSDWIGTAGADNTYVIDQGEGIWADMAFDDTANGSVIYPNGTHTGPTIFDSAGAPWSEVDNKTVALSYPDKFGGTGVEPYWYKHGGMVDLREFRITGDTNNLYMLFRFENMGSQAIACEYNAPGGTHEPTDPRFPYVNATGFGKILIQVYVGKDVEATLGRTNATMWGNFNLSSPWDFVIDVAGDVTWSSQYPLGYPRIEFANGTVVHLNQTETGTAPLQPKKAIYVQANCDIYPSAIELKMPYSIIGDPIGDAWNFFVVAGGFDEGRWRQYWSTSFAQLMGWPPLFRFCGGEGGDPPAPMGNDANIVDMTFTVTQAEQEALLNEFQTTGQLVKIDAYQKIEFDATGDVVSEKLIYSLLVVAPILLVIILYVRKPKLNRTVKRY